MINSVWVLRRKNHLSTRLELRDEKVHLTRLFPWLASVMISFTAVDCLVGDYRYWPYYLSIRIMAVILARVLFVFLRGRGRYGLRLLATVSPYVFAVEYIMVWQNLTFTPYFAGITLVMVTSSMLFPVRTKVAYAVYLFCLIPLAIYYPLNPPENLNLLWLPLLMGLGSVYVCSVNTGQVYDDYCAKLIVKEQLARDLGKRKKEISDKAKEILQRRVFESQFSPQVVQTLMQESGKSYNQMKRRGLIVLVMDIENSTFKASTLDPDSYKSVVEEVVDVFSAACLKWNITVDRFVGDGMMAFAGAPIMFQDDLFRSFKAIGDAVGMLEARRSELEEMWRSILNIRFSIVEGEANVGFMGRGIFKSFTAIGDHVSFAHRICSIAEPWTIAFYSFNKHNNFNNLISEFEIKNNIVSQIKGFPDRDFSISILIRKENNNILPNLGRCPQCSTPLVLVDMPGGLAKVECPGCKIEVSTKAA